MSGDRTFTISPHFSINVPFEGGLGPSESAPEQFGVGRGPLGSETEPEREPCGQSGVR